MNDRQLDQLEYRSDWPAVRRDPIIVEVFGGQARTFDPTLGLSLARAALAFRRAFHA